MGSETRDRILAAAARLFHEQGFSGTSVAEILRESGVNSGSLYHFFPGKGALLVGVLDRYLESLRPSLLDRAESATRDPIERLFALLELYRGMLVISDMERGCPVGALALEVRAEEAEARARIDEYFARWIAGVRAWLDRAGDRLPPDVDRDALARLALAVMQGGAVQARAAGSLEPFDRSVSAFRAYMASLRERATHEAVEPLTRVAAPPPRGTEVPATTAGHRSSAPDGRPADVRAGRRPEEAEAPAGDGSGWRSW